MKQSELEPGFLQAYRLFAATCIVFWVVIGPILAVLSLADAPGLAPTLSSRQGLVERMTFPSVAPLILTELFLLLLLFWPGARRRLGGWFLPATLWIGMVPLLVGYYWWPSENPLQTPFVIFFFVMLVLIAWQYPFPYVIAYVLGLTVYQLLVSRSALDLPWAVDAGWLILQGSMMLLVGYVIVAMVSIQREQRDALARAYQQQTAANVRLQQYAATLEELAISRERNRLARELHDTLAHSLSAVTIQLEAIRALWRNDLDAALAMLRKADQTARSGLTEARRALQDLRATPLEDLGLPLALQDMAQAAAERCGAALELDVPRQLEPGLSPALEQSVYRIAQEALENIVRHAEARTIMVSLSNPGATIRLRIADDGRGAASESGSAPNTEEGARMGVLGMQERAAMIGGRLEIRSEVGQGTEVLLQVPV